MTHLPDLFRQDGTGLKTTEKPGIVVFSTSLKLLDRNRRAEELMAVLTAMEPALSNMVPAAVDRFCHSIMELLSQCRAMPVWVQVSERQAANEPIRSVLIRGFGLRKDTHPENSRIVMVLEERPFEGMSTSQTGPLAPRVFKGDNSQLC